ncbi:drug/metabolite transporter superfamily [Athelia psychrophila]|uniref:Drug/metabolite transporter superfamily n=1 Tax=Athelia psychrophila TaxID=1759441 RepID=A0A166MS79_9AGAM|nr:drug/metabolite transporter superfamily [Fibularhizoctonia sp. CBS 109695]
MGHVNANTGLLLVAAAQLFFSLMNLVAKKVSTVDPPVPTLELILIRMLITWICCVWYMYYTKVPDPILGPKGVRLLLVTRGFVGFFGLFGVYYSLQYLSLSDATVLTFLAPIATGVTGALLLGETFGRREGLAGLCSLIGVVLIARPTFIFGAAALPVDGGAGAERGTPEQRLGAVGVALIGVLGATGAYTTLRAIGKRAHAMHSLVGFSAWCVIVSGVGMAVTRTPFIIPHRWDFVLMLFAMGVFGFIAQTLLTMGLQRETAGRGTLAVYIQIVFASILERIFFHSTPSALSIVGNLIILSSALYVAVRLASPPLPPSTPSSHPPHPIHPRPLILHFVPVKIPR